MSRDELPALTIARFVLALHALVYHVEVAWNARAPAGGAGDVLSAGYVSVNGFFVLSGFVLAYSYAGKGHWRGGGAFFRARFARIYPMHLLGVALMVPLVFAANRGRPDVAPEVLHQVALVTSLVQAWLPAHALDVNGPSWSLSVEAFFYLLFPLLLRLLAPLRTRALLSVAVGSFGLALIAPLAHPLAHGIAGASNEDRIVLFNPLLHLPELVLGLVTGLLFLERRVSGRRWRWVALGASIAYVVLLSCSSAFPIALLHSGLLDPLVALLLFSLAAGWAPGSSGPGTRVALMLGRSSYALYILHKPIYLWMGRASGLARSVPSTAFVFAYVTVAVVTSVVAWAWVEEPLRRWLSPTGGASSEALAPAEPRVEL